jgi:hypothetical protein
MTLLIVNLDKQQYVRPVTFGPDGAGGRAEVPARNCDDVTCFRLLLTLLEAVPVSPGSLRGSWAGDRVAVLDSDEASARFLTEEDLAMYVLARTKPSNFQFVSAQYTDVTGALLGDCLLETFTGHDWFERVLRGCCLKSLTPQRAKQLLAEAARECGAHHGEFLQWFTSQRDLKREVRDLALAGLDAQEKPRRAPGARSGRRGGRR